MNTAMDVISNAPVMICLSLSVVLQVFPDVAQAGAMRCVLNLESCPAGHQMKMCAEADSYKCEQCSDITFQPNENRFGDNCRIRKICNRSSMKFKDYGSTIKDNNCMCVTGYHFESEDQRACVPNRECAKGYGQGSYGVCDECLKKGMFSDIKDREQPCKPLKNCRSFDRCTMKKSNGTFDNICGPQIKDISKCDSMNFSGGDPMSESQTMSTGAVAGIAIGCLLFVLIIAILIFVFCCKKAPRRDAAPSPSQLEEARDKVIQRSEKDGDYCKRVLDSTFRKIEGNINKQIWNLPRLLFSNHFQPGKSEVEVEKCKGMSPRNAVKTYLRDWITWKGETVDALRDLFDSLKKCNRDDIMFDVCWELEPNNNLPETVVNGLDTGGSNKHPSKHPFFSNIAGAVLPCSKKSRQSHRDEKTENVDTMRKLLDGETASKKAVDNRPNPSAPIEDHTVVPCDPYLHRQESFPVQASS